MSYQEEQELRCADMCGHVQTCLVWMHCFSSRIEKDMASVSRPDACVTRCHSAIRDRQVYEKAEHIELLGSETPSKHVLQQLLCCIKSYLLFFFCGQHLLSYWCHVHFFRLHTHALFKIYICTTIRTQWYRLPDARGNEWQFASEAEVDWRLNWMSCIFLNIF